MISTIYCVDYLEVRRQSHIQTWMVNLFTVIILVSTQVSCDKENGAWVDAVERDELASYKKFVEKYPGGEHSSAAADRISTIEWENAKAVNSVDAYTLFLSNHPDDIRAGDAEVALYISQERDSPTIENFESFLEDQAEDKRLTEARVVKQILDRISGQKLSQASRNEPDSQKPVIQAANGEWGSWDGSESGMIFLTLFGPFQLGSLQASDGLVSSMSIRKSENLQITLPDKKELAGIPIRVYFMWDKGMPEAVAIRGI